jgi:G:T-mismatch repair DNA endonuclease (very short patch repair protein)
VWIGGYPVDGFDSATNTIYLYHGSFWHGNPVMYAAEDINPMLNKTYGELYERTLTIEQSLRDKGFTVVVKWEH